MSALKVSITLLATVSAKAMDGTASSAAVMTLSRMCLILPATAANTVGVDHCNKDADRVKFVYLFRKME
jgi:hypothetical protein